MATLGVRQIGQRSFIVAKFMLFEGREYEAERADTRQAKRL